MLTRQIPFLCQLEAAVVAQLGVPSAWCTPRKSHVELRARKFSENVTYYLCGAHHTDGTSNAICVVYTTQMQSMWCTPLECDLLGAHRTTRPRVQSMWCTPLECELRGAHRTTRPSVQATKPTCDLPGVHHAHGNGAVGIGMRPSGLDAPSPRRAPRKCQLEGPALTRPSPPFRDPSQGPLTTIEPK